MKVPSAATRLATIGIASTALAVFSAGTALACDTKHISHTPTPTPKVQQHSNKDCDHKPVETPKPSTKPCPTPSVKPSTKPCPPTTKPSVSPTPHQSTKPCPTHSPKPGKGAGTPTPTVTPSTTPTGQVLSATTAPTTLPQTGANDLGVLGVASFGGIATSAVAYLRSRKHRS